MLYRRRTEKGKKSDTIELKILYPRIYGFTAEILDGFFNHLPDIRFGIHFIHSLIIFIKSKGSNLLYPHK
jgi:hypothetical protein